MRVGLTSGEFAQLENARNTRERHLALLEGYRVKAGAKRTTPGAAFDIPTLVPELKALSKVTLRLHPRFGDEPQPDESKLGGRFLWPADEPWPTDPPTGLPLVPVLQLRQEDAPPNFAFRPGTDLLQLLWCPRAELRPVIAWRKRAAVSGDLAPYPDTEFANADFTPVPCRVFPERVTEYPCYAVLPASVREKIDGAKTISRDTYDEMLSATNGTKVGGYPRWRGTAASPPCPSCGWGMDYLLTVAGKEWGTKDQVRWKPMEEAETIEDLGFRSAAGLMIGSALLFVCRRCENWPLGFRLA